MHPCNISIRVSQMSNKRIYCRRFIWNRRIILFCQFSDKLGLLPVVCRMFSDHHSGRFERVLFPFPVIPYKTPPYRGGRGILVIHSVKKSGETFFMPPCTLWVWSTVPFNHGHMWKTSVLQQLLVNLLLEKNRIVKTVSYKKINYL